MSEKILQLMGRLPRNAPSVSHDSAVKAEMPAVNAAEAAGEAAVAAAVEDLQNKKRMKKAALVKLGAMCVFLGVAVVFMTISWFTMSRETNSSGMNMKANDQEFEITMLEDSGTGEEEGIFKDPYHIKVHESDALYWEMTADNNLKNYNPAVENDDPELASVGDLGVYPDASGVISFYVTPKVDSLDLKFDLEVIGYQSTETNGQLVSMTPLSDLADGAGDNAQALLNGHILLFEKRTRTTSGGVTATTYSDPILSDADMHRVFYRKITGQGQRSQVDIYWVWPNTLSTIIDSTSYTGTQITTVPFCSGSDYNKLKTNVESYPHYYLKGVGTDDTVTAANIAGYYDTYRDMYDQGDNEIGMRVHYLLLKLSVTEGTAAGGGS